MQKSLFSLFVLVISGVVFSACAASTPPETENTPVETPAQQESSLPNTDQPSEVSGESTPKITPGDEMTSGEMRSIPLSEVAQHASETDCWSAIDGDVYDLTSFVGKHPGGQAILKICGKDGSAIFNNQHGEQQKQLAQQFKIGVLAE